MLQDNKYQDFGLLGVVLNSRRVLLNRVLGLQLKLKSISNSWTYKCLVRLV